MAGSRHLGANPPAVTPAQAGADGSNRHLYSPRSANRRKALHLFWRHPYLPPLRPGVLCLHHPARADIDDGRWRGTGRAEETSSSAGLRRHASGDSARTDRPSGNPASARLLAPKGGKATRHRASSPDAQGGLWWPPHYQSRGHTPRRLRPQTLRGSDPPEPGGHAADGRERLPLTHRFSVLHI